MASRHYKYNASCPIMCIWSSRLLLRRVPPGTRPVTTTPGTHPGDNNLWESVTPIARNPQQKSRTRRIPDDIYRWASHSVRTLRRGVVVACRSGDSITLHLRASPWPELGSLIQAAGHLLTPAGQQATEENGKPVRTTQPTNR